MNALTPRNAAAMPTLTGVPMSWNLDIGGDWAKPGEITTPQREAAIAKRAELRAWLARRPNPRALTEWLLDLGNLTTIAGGMTADQAMAKLATYGKMLDLPPECYTRDTLKRAAECDGGFFPSYAKLRACLQREVEPQNRACARLTMIVEGCRVDDPEPPGPATPEQIANVERMASEARQRLAGSLQTAPRYLPSGDPARSHPAARQAALAEIAAHRERNAQPVEAQP